MQTPAKVNVSDGLILAANAPTKETYAATIGGLLYLAEAGILQQCKVFISHRNANLAVYQLNQLMGHMHHSRAPFTLLDDLDDLSGADDDDTILDQPQMSGIGVLAAGVETFFPSHSVEFAEPVTPLGQAIAKYMVPSALEFVTTNHELSAMRLYWSALRRNIGLRLRFCTRHKSKVNSAYYKLADEWSRRINLTSTWNEVYTYTCGRSLLCLAEIAPVDEMKLHSHAVTQSYTVFPGYNTTTRKSVLFHNQDVHDGAGEWISEDEQLSHAYYTANLTSEEGVSEDIVSSLVLDPEFWGALKLPNYTFESNLQMDPTLRHAADLYFQFTRMPKIAQMSPPPRDDDWLLKQIHAAPSRRVILLDGICGNAYYHDKYPHTYTRAVISTGEYNASNSGESVQLFGGSHASFCESSFLDNDDDLHTVTHELCKQSTPRLTTDLCALNFYNLLDWGYHVTRNAYPLPYSEDE